MDNSSFARPKVGRPTWGEIDLAALAHNFHIIKDQIGPDTKILAAVKANAYGHGAVECARRLESEGADWFGVALPEEGIELRKAGITRPILCLGGFWPGLMAFAFVTAAGAVLGRLLGGLLFRPSSGGPPDPPPQV